MIGDLIGCGISLFVAYEGFLRMQTAIERHTRSSTTGASFHIWPFILVFSIGFCLLALSFIWDIVRLIKRHGIKTMDPRKDEAPAEANEVEGGAE